MISRSKDGPIAWIDLENPTRAEVQAVVNEFNLDSTSAEELLMPSTKPRVEFNPAYVYVILHFPALHHSHKTLEQEVDFVIGRNFLITAHYDMIDPLHKFSKVLEVNAMLGTHAQAEHAGYLFFSILTRLYRAVEHETEYVRHDLSAIEERTFSGQEVAMVAAISRSARDLLNLRQTIEPHREILHSLESDGLHFFGEDFASHLRAISNKYYLVHNHIMRHTDALHELRETNNSLLTTKQNEVVKTFTVLAFFTFPLMLITSIFSMDTAHTPIVGGRYDFWVVLGILSTLSIIMYAFFKHKRWF